MPAFPVIYEKFLNSPPLRLRSSEYIEELNRFTNYKFNLLSVVSGNENFTNKYTKLRIIERENIENVRKPILFKKAVLTFPLFVGYSRC